MMDIAPILGAIRRRYPAPQVDPAWVTACVKALLEDGQEPTVDAVMEQYLYSDLSHSTLPSSLIPSSAHQVHLFPTSTLLQILSVTEIGSSAFTLQTVLEQRRDVLDGATRIRRMDDELISEGGDADGAGGAAEDGKLPAYPRSMLRMELTDGERVIKGIEYRRIETLVLGETALGCKLLVRNVKALRGTLLLTPENSQVLGYSVEHLEAEQPTKFAEGLKTRLSKPSAQSGATAPRALGLDGAAVRGVAPVGNEGKRVTMPPRAGGRTATSSVSGSDHKSGRSGVSALAPIPRPSGTANASTLTIPISRSIKHEPPLPHLPSSPHRLIRPTARHQSRPAKQNGAANIKQLNDVLPHPSTADARPPRIGHDGAEASGAGVGREVIVVEDDEWDMNVNDSFIRRIEEVEASARAGLSTGAGRMRGEEQIYDLSDGFEVDEAMLRKLDDLEAIASGSGAPSGSHPVTCAAARQRDEEGWECSEHEEHVEHFEPVRSSGDYRRGGAVGDESVEFLGVGRMRGSGDRLSVRASGTSKRARRVRSESEDSWGKENQPVVVDDD